MTATAAADWPPVAQPGEGLPAKQPPTARPTGNGTTQCTVNTCRAWTRTAKLDTGAPVMVDAEPVDSGTLVWRNGPAGWVLHQLAADEPALPQDRRRFRRHADTCTPHPPAHRAPATTGHATDTLAAAGLQPRHISTRAPLRLAAVDGERVPDPAPADPPPLAELTAAQPADTRTCPDCGMVCAAVVPALEDGRPLLIEQECATGDVVAVAVDGQVRARRTIYSIVDSDPSPYWHRWGSHRCRAYPYRCQSPVHDQHVPGRLYAGGAYCDDCARTRRR